MFFSMLVLCVARNYIKLIILSGRSTFLFLHFRTCNLQSIDSCFVSLCCSASEQFSCFGQISFNTLTFIVHHTKIGHRRYSYSLLAFSYDGSTPTCTKCKPKSSTTTVVVYIYKRNHQEDLFIDFQNMDQVVVLEV